MIKCDACDVDVTEDKEGHIMDALIELSFDGLPILCGRCYDKASGPLGDPVFFASEAAHSLVKLSQS